MRSGKKKGAVMVIVVLLLLGCLGLAGWELLKIREIEVTGVTGTDADTVLSLAGIEMDSNILLVDGKLVKERVDAGAVFCVEKVDLHYPDKVSIEVRRREAMCALEYIGAYLILDDAGYVLSVEQQMPSDDCPVVIGFKAQNAVVGQVVESSDGYQLKVLINVLSSLKKAGLKDVVKEIDVTSSGDIKLLTGEGVTVRLGQNEKMEKKMAWMRTLLPDLEENVLDVSAGDSANVYNGGAESTHTEPEDDDGTDDISPLPGGE